MRLRKRNGIWHVWYRDSLGRRCSKSTKCSDRRAAEIAGGRIERQAQDPAYRAQNQTTLGDAVNLMLAALAERVAAGERSEGALHMHTIKGSHVVRVLEAGGPLPLWQLGAAHVDGYVSTRRGEGAASNTIAKELVSLRCSLKLAKRRGLWAGDVAAVMPIAFATGYKPRTRWLPWREVWAILPRLLPDQAARVAFIVATSASWGEAERAQRRDIRDGLVHLRGTKRASRLRNVPLVADWQRDLIRYATMHAEGIGGQLFRSWGNVRRDLARACELNEIAPCTPNDLRRTFAHWMRAAGVPLDLVSRCMGHSDTRMVERVYGRLDVSELGAAMGRALGSTWCTSGADSAAPAGSAGLPGQPRTAQGREIAREMVPRDGIEPPTRGFSVPPRIVPGPRKRTTFRGLDVGRGALVVQRERRTGARRRG